MDFVSIVRHLENAAAPLLRLHDVPSGDHKVDLMLLMETCGVCLIPGTNTLTQSYESSDKLPRQKSNIF